MSEQTRSAPDAYLWRWNEDSPWQASVEPLPWHLARAVEVRPLYTRAELTDEQQLCQPNGLMFDAFGQPRTRYVRVSLNGSHCVMRPSEGDTYIKDARDNGDESAYVVRDVYLSEREFDDLPEFDGF